MRQTERTTIRNAMGRGLTIFCGHRNIVVLPGRESHCPFWGCGTFERASVDPTYFSRPCYCENLACRVGHDDSHCLSEGTVPVAYVGSICAPCARFMPNEYLDGYYFDDEGYTRNRHADEDAATRALLAGRWRLASDSEEHDLDRVAEHERFLASAGADHLFEGRGE